MSNEVLIEKCSIGRDAPSGKAFLVTLVDGRELWVPYSQVSRRAVDKKQNGNDSFYATAWWASANDVKGRQV